MNFLKKYVSDLCIEIIDNKERLYFYSRNVDRVSIDREICKNDLHYFGFFFINLLNKKNEVISFFDKILSKISEEEIPIYYSSVIYDLLQSENKIDCDFVPFYLHTIANEIEKDRSLFDNSQEEKKKVEEEIEYLSKLLLSDVELKKSFEKNIKHEKNRLILAELSDEKINEIMKSFPYANLKSYKEYLEKRKLQKIEQYETFKDIWETAYSPDKCKTDILMEVEIDRDSFIKKIDTLNFLLGIDTKNYTKNQIDFINKEMIIPRCRKVLCYEENNKYFSYSNIYNKVFTNRKLNFEDEIKKLVKPLQLNIYEINNFSELLDVYINYFVDNNIDLRQCENCGKYFISENGTKYCNSISPQDTKKTCIEIGPKYKYSNKDITIKYNTLINRYRSKINHCSNIQTKTAYRNDLTLFKKDYEKLKKSKVSEMEVEKWLEGKIKQYDLKYRKNR